MRLTKFIEKHGDHKVDENELKDLLKIKEKYYIPRNDEEYYFVTSFGGVSQWFNSEPLSDRDEGLIKNSEVFRTEEEAQHHANKQRFLLKMKRDFLDNSDEIDWEDRINLKFTLGYNWETDEIEIFANWQFVGGVLYTTNDLWLEEYIEKHEEEIKKYYFGIEEE